jgi:hypothetical protein
MLLIRSGAFNFFNLAVIFLVFGPLFCMLGCYICFVFHTGSFPWFVFFSSSTLRYPHGRLELTAAFVKAFPSNFFSLCVPVFLVDEARDLVFPCVVP